MPTVQHAFGSLQNNAHIALITTGHSDTRTAMTLCNISHLNSHSDHLILKNILTMKNKILIIITLIGSVFGLTAQQNDNYTILEVQAYKDSISHKKVQLIDVRTPEEYNDKYIQYADNIDFFSKEFNKEFGKLNMQQPVYIYCRSGNRSKRAADTLSAMGFKKIYDLKGGILNYE